MYTLDTKHDGQTAILDVRESMTAKEYEKLKGELEPLFQKHTKLDLVIDVSGLSAMSLGAMGRDLTYTLKHFNDFRRVAVVGDSTWQAWLAKLGDALPNIEAQYFGTSSKTGSESETGSETGSETAAKTEAERWVTA